MNKLISLLLTFSFIVFSFSQEKGTIKGRVFDENGEVLFSASVIADISKSWATTTNLAGEYSLALPPGKYTLTATYIGYSKVEKTIQIGENQTYNLDFTLLPSEEMLNTVEVYSATKRGISREKEVVTVETIDATLIQNNIITIASDAIDRVPGVTMLDGQISIRGGSGYAYGAGSRVILVLDDIPFLSPERNEILWDFVPVENTKSIDVVKGASSVLYGSAALNGVIAVRTKWPTKLKETNLRFSTKLYDSPPIKEAKWWAYDDNFRDAPHEMTLEYAHLRKLKQNMDLVSSGAFVSSKTHIQGNFNHRVRNMLKWRFRPENIEGLTVSVAANTLYRNNSQFFLWEDGEEGAYTGRTYRDSYFRAYIDPKINYIFKENNQISFNNRFYYDQRLGKNYIGEYNGFRSYQDIAYKRFFANKSKDIKSTISLGLTNSYDRIKAISFWRFSRKENGLFYFNTISTYTQGDFSWKDLTLAAGARFDYVSLDGTKAASKPVFNAGVSYELLNKNFFRFGFGQSFRIPSVAERYVKEKLTSFSGLDIYVLPNPDIKPETGYTYELGYKKILQSAKYDLELDAAIFYQSFDQMTEFIFGFYQDPIDTNKTNVGFKMLNVAKARTFGWEFNYNGTHKFKKVNFNYNLGYTYNYCANAEDDPSLLKFKNVLKNAFKAYHITQEEYDEFNARNNKDNILYGIMLYRFRHVFKSDFNIEVLSKFNIGTNIRYYGFLDKITPALLQAIPGIEEYREQQNNRGEVVVDLRTSYQFNETFKLSVIVRNLMNNDYHLRPAKPDAPRTFAIQGNLFF